MAVGIPDQVAIPLIGRAKSTYEWLQLVSRHSFDAEALHLIRQRRSHLHSLCNAHAADIPKQLQDGLRRAEYHKPDCCISPPDTLGVSADELKIGVSVFVSMIEFKFQDSPRLSISRLQKLSEVFPAVCSGYVGVPNVLGNMYHRCFQNDGLVADLDEAIKQARSARALATGEDRAAMSNNLFSWLQTRRNFAELTGPMDWDEFIEVSRESMGSDYGSSKALDLGVVLLEYCRVTRDDKSFKSVLDHYKLVLEHTPPENVDARLRALSDFGCGCLYHFQRYHTPQYVSDAIDRLQEAALLATPTKSVDPALRYAIFANLGVAFAFRFAVSSDSNDITVALQHFHQAGEPPPDHADIIVQGFSRALDLYAKLPRDLSTLDASLRRVRDILKSTSAIYQTDLLRVLSYAHLVSYERTGCVTHLDFAIEDLRGILDKGIDQEDIALCHLAVAFERRFERLGRVEDLEYAFTLLDCGRAFAQPASKVSLMIYNALGVCCRQRYLQSGSLTDLDTSIAHLRTALVDGDWEANPSQKDVQWMLLQNLGASLSRRYLRLHDETDIAESITCLDQSIDGMRNFHPGHLSLLIAIRELAISLQLTGDITDIDRAIYLLRQALEHMANGDFYQDTFLLRLAESLRHRFEATNVTSDLDDAIECMRKALQVSPHDSLWRPGHLSTQGRALLTRCDIIAQHRIPPRDPSSLDNLRQSVEEAIQCFTEAIELAQPDSSWQSMPESRYRLGLAYLAKFNYFHENAILTAAITQFRLCAQTLHGPSDCKLRAAVKWAVNMHDRGEWASAHEAYSLVIPLLSEVAWMGLDPSARLRELSQTQQGLANDAAACAIQLSEVTTGCERQVFLERAVESLDHGRSVFWSQGSQLDTAFEELRSVDADLMQEFRRVIPALQNSLHSDYFLEALEFPGGSNSRHAHLVLEQRASNRRALVEEWEGLLSKARSLPGLENFMRPLPFSKLRQAADRGPIILVNSSRFRRDAMIIDFRGHIHLIPLDPPDSKRQGSESPASDRLPTLAGDLIHERAIRPLSDSETPDPREILDTLWRQIACPVLNKIDDVWPEYPVSHMSIPRVWWCLTGSLTSIPIHAAQPFGGNGVLDRTISSYTSTLSALFRLKQKRDELESFAFLAVSQSHTPGHAPLPGVAAEMEIIRSLPGSKSFTFIADEHATLSTVTEELSRCTWAHFACHGQQYEQSPLQSALIMHDGPLHVSKLSQLTPHAEFAMLLACETAKGERLLPDEAMHVVASFQFAGFRSVIGTSSKVDDTTCHKVARHVYGHLFRNGPDGALPDPSEAAEALRAAVLELRKANLQNLAYWTPFIHFGA